jgi:hypothetical protein
VDDAATGRAEALLLKDLDPDPQVGLSYGEPGSRRLLNGLLVWFVIRRHLIAVVVAAGALVESVLPNVKTAAPTPNAPAVAMIMAIQSNCSGLGVSWTGGDDS